MSISIRLCLGNLGFGGSVVSQNLDKPGLGIVACLTHQCNHVPLHCASMAQTAQKAFGEFRLVCAKHLAKSSRADVIEAVGSSGQASILQPAQLAWTAAKTHKKFMVHPLILDNKARVAVVESLAPAQLKELGCDAAAVSATSSTLVEELGLQATRQSPTGLVLEEETTVAATMPPLLRLPTDAEVDAHIMAKNEKQTDVFPRFLGFACCTMFGAPDG